MEVGGTGTFTAVRRVRKGDELLFAYDKDGRGGYWRQWGKRGAMRRGAREAPNPSQAPQPQAPHTPNAGEWRRQGDEDDAEQRGSKHDGVAREKHGPDDGGAWRGGWEAEERDSDGGEESKAEGREHSGGVWGERAREAELRDSSRASGKGKRKRNVESGSGSSSGRAVRHSNIRNRASAAVVSGLERRLQQVQTGMMGADSGGTTWFERGEGGGVT